jgi:hypothetical protein
MGLFQSQSRSSTGQYASESLADMTSAAMNAVVPAAPAVPQ